MVHVGVHSKLVFVILPKMALSKPIEYTKVAADPNENTVVKPLDTKGLRLNYGYCISYSYRI